MQTEGTWCSDGGCGVTVPTETVAKAAGWDQVEGEWFCALHRTAAARRALAAAETARLRAKITELRVERNEIRAQRTLDAAMYRAWDEFQADLVNFHREHGELAPVALRTLDPRQFAKIYAETGKIDIEEAVKAAEEAEKKAEETRRWLATRQE